MKLKHILCAAVLFGGMATERVHANPRTTRQEERIGYFARAKAKVQSFLKQARETTYRYMVEKPLNYFDKKANHLAEFFVDIFYMGPLNGSE